MGHAAAIGHTTPWGGEEADTEKRRQRGLLRAGAARADIRAAALTAHQARGLPQAGGHVAGWNRRRQCEVHLQDPVHLAFRAQYLANAESWKDLRAVHDSRGLCSERGPSQARSSRDAFPKGDLRGFSDTRRAYLAKASSFWMHGARILPGRGAFPVPGPFWGYIERKNCHGLPPGNAPRRSLATASRPRAHCKHALLCSSLRRMHRGRMLPCPTARGRTAASCQLSRTSSCERVQELVPVTSHPSPSAG